MWKLKKGLYGLKQGSRIWNKKIDEKLRKIRFTKLSIEWLIYHCRSESGLLIVVPHVNDMNML